jgi:hypothetical protein
MKRRLQQIDESIDRYLGQMASADRQESSEDKSQRLEDKISALKKEMARLKKLEARMLRAPGQQISLTDPDARSMAVQARLDREPERMRVRRETAEHPFGTIKSWMGSTHFLTRGLPSVSIEMSLHVMAYNLKRMMNIFGVKPLIEAIRA